MNTSESIEAALLEALHTGDWTYYYELLNYGRKH
jgi:hypothetical protein